MESLLIVLLVLSVLMNWIIHNLYQSINKTLEGTRAENKKLLLIITKLRQPHIAPELDKRIIEMADKLKHYNEMEKEL